LVLKKHVPQDNVPQENVEKLVEELFHQTTFPLLKRLVLHEELPRLPGETLM
jgi:hypothetical protein